MSLQLEINKRLYMDETTRRRAPASSRCSASWRRWSTPSSTTRRASSRAGARARRHRTGAPRRSASSSSAAPAGRCRRTRVKVDRTTRWGNPFTIAECGSVAVAVAAARPLDARRDRRAGRRRAAVGETLRAALAGRNLACWCAAERAVPRRPAADARQSALARLPRLAAGSRQRERRDRAAARAGSSASRGRDGGRRSP